MSANLISMMTVILINISSIVLIILVLRSAQNEKTNRWFSLMALLIICWVNSSFFASVFNNNQLSIISYKINGAVVALFLYVFYVFFINFLKIYKKRDVLLYIIFCASVIFAFLSLFTNYIVKGVQVNQQMSNVIFGTLDNCLNIFASSVSILIFYLAFNRYYKSDSKEKKRIKYLFIGISIFIIANILFNILIPFFTGSSIYQHLGDFSFIFFLGFTAFAIIKHQLFDVKLAVIRSVTYTLVLITLACIYLILSFLLSAIFNKELTSPGQTVSGVAISLVLAFVFQPIKRFFDRVTDKIFYRDNYNTDDFYARLNNTLTLTTDLRSLLERTAYEIADTLKCEQAFFFIHTFDDHFITAGTHGYSKMPRDDALELQIVDEMDYGLFIASLRDENDPIRRLMVSHKIELILPLRQSNVIGYLCLGDHRTSNYTGKDIRVLNTIADELVIAIQNALAIQEVRELNTNLQQKINNATRELRNSNMMLRKLDKIKDEFVSIASHQLRTPLTSVKGYVSMILDGDAGKINNQQRELLGEAFISSERMVHLINDFLNVSRLQTGKFMIDKKPTDLSKVVGEEIDSLRPSAVSRGIEFIYKPPKNIPILDIDEGKIRQVIMNFADNSLYYSDKDTKVKIDLHIEDNDIVFTVKDRGIGVPKNEQAQLFSKFYRASNARLRRPDGTGVGLFLAKKVIDAHKGQIVFESSEGKGSTFGFRLPIAENSQPSPE